MAPSKKKAIIIILKHILFYYRTKLKTISVLFTVVERIKLLYFCILYFFNLKKCIGNT